MLSVCISCAASNDSQSCVLNGLQFLDVGVLYDRAPYDVPELGRVIALWIFFLFTHFVEVNGFRMLRVCFVLLMLYVL